MVRAPILSSLLTLSLRAANPHPRLNAASPPGQETFVVTCSTCKASYVIQPDQLGEGNGRRVRCDNCGNEWFQSTNRLHTLPNNMELVEYPKELKDRIDKGLPAEIAAQFRAYVSNIPFSVREDELRDLFASYGEVASVNIITDDATGRSRGFAFVGMVDREEGSRASSELDGYVLQGRAISVSEGRQQPREGRGRGRGRGRGDRGRGYSQGRGTF